MTYIRTFQFTVQAAPTTALQTACSGLAAGQSRLFISSTTLQSVKGSVDLYAGLDWQQKFSFANGKAHLLAKPPSGSILGYYTYDESTDQWARQYQGAPLGNSVGHVWGGNPFDPATETVWWQNDNAADRDVLRYDTGAADWVSEFSPTNWVNSEACPFVWHPNLYESGAGGIVYWVGTALYAWRKSNGAMSTLGTVSNGAYTGLGVYDSTANRVLMFGSDRSCWAIAEGGAITRYGDTPSRVAVGSSLDPLGGYLAAFSQTGRPLLLQRPTTTGDVWMLNETTKAWDAQSFKHPFYTAIEGTTRISTSETLGTTSGPISTCNAYGCVWAIGGNRSDYLAHSALWKPPV